MQVFESQQSSSPDAVARRKREFVKSNDVLLRAHAEARAREKAEARADAEAERGLLATFSSMDRDASAEAARARLFLRDENKRLVGVFSRMICGFWSRLRRAFESTACPAALTRGESA
jgi:hypothetical protein